MSWSGTFSAVVTHTGSLNNFMWLFFFAQETLQCSASTQNCMEIHMNYNHYYELSIPMAVPWARTFLSFSLVQLCKRRHWSNWWQNKWNLVQALCATTSLLGSALFTPNYIRCHWYIRIEDIQMISYPHLFIPTKVWCCIGWCPSGRVAWILWRYNFIESWPKAYHEKGWHMLLHEHHKGREFSICR